MNLWKALCEGGWRLRARWLRLTRNTYQWDLLMLNVMADGQTARLKWLRGLDVFWSKHEAFYLQVASCENSRDGYRLLLNEVETHRIVPLRYLLENLMWEWLVRLEDGMSNLTRDVLCRSPETSFLHRRAANDRSNRVLVEAEAATRLAKDGKPLLLPPKAKVLPFLDPDRERVLTRWLEPELPLIAAE